MRSRKLGGQGVDPRENKAHKEQEYSLPTTEALVMQTIIPFFAHQAAQAGAAATAAGSHTSHSAAHCLPFLDRIDESLPRVTRFSVDEHEAVQQFVAQLFQDCPAVTQRRETFLACMASAYDKAASA